jgi:cell division protein FtsB
MIDKLRNSRGWQLLTITTLILIVPLMADINGRIDMVRRMHRKEVQLRQELDQVQRENSMLHAELEQITDLTYLERWARVEARMTRTGEVAIIPVLAQVPDYGAQPPQQDPSTEEAPLTTSDEWRHLFFDAAASQ